jgi:hypothetical protein
MDEDWAEVDAAANPIVPAKKYCRNRITTKRAKRVRRR